MSANQYSQLLSAFKNTKGFEVYNLTKSIQISFDTFAKNGKELRKKLLEHSDLSSLSRFDGMSNREELQAEFLEIVRLIHNYVASAMSLVEHTRRISRKLFEPGPFGIYQKRVDTDFRESALHGFIQDLRNYLLHYSHPPVNRTVRFEPSHVKSIGIEFSVKELRQWDGWGKRSRPFFETATDGIVLIDVVSDYTKKMVDFLNWLQAHINESRKEDLNELWEKHDKWADFCRQNGIPVTEEEFRQSFAADSKPKQK